MYLDNAATTQKPREVISAIVKFYEHDNANVGRGESAMGDKATDMYEVARLRVAQFLNATKPEEIVFTRGATEGLNTVAYSWGMERLKRGDKVLISEMEHHANLVPWQIVRDKTGAQIVTIPVDPDGDIDQKAYEKLLDDKCKVLALSHVSNVLGTINPVKEMVEKFKRVSNGVCVIDAAQSVAHMRVDVRDIGADFLVFSGHKVYGPMGIGVLFGRQELLESMPPCETGGGMIERVTMDHVSYKKAPFKFEAGTPNVAGAIGLGSALKLVMDLGRERIERRESLTAAHLLHNIESVPGLTVYGHPKHRTALASFTIRGRSATEVGAHLDSKGIQVRVGSHCAMPIHDALGVVSTVRASLAVYNTLEEISRLTDTLLELVHSRGLVSIA